MRRHFLFVWKYFDMKKVLDYYISLQKILEWIFLFIETYCFEINDIATEHKTEIINTKKMRDAIDETSFYICMNGEDPK